jgi:hypothetical protein
MSSIESRFEGRRQHATAGRASATHLQAAPPPWQCVWDRICRALETDLTEFNKECGVYQFVAQALTRRTIIQVVPARGSRRIATVVLELTDRQGGELKLTCPPEGPGIGRRGRFRLGQGRIEVLPGFVGKPPSGPMSPEEFSRFVLEPLLFPNLQ